MAGKGIHLQITGRRRAGKATRLTLASSSGPCGSIAEREVFDGVKLVLLDIHGCEGGAVTGLPSSPCTYQLVHCSRGSRVYAGASGRSLLQVEPGQLAMVKGGARDYKLRFPEGRYRGLSVQLAGQLMPNDMKLLFRAFFDLDLEAMAEQALSGRPAAILPPDADSSHVFSEIYAFFTYAERAILRLKVLELLAVSLHAEHSWGHTEPVLDAPASAPNKHVAIAYQAQEVLARDLTEEVSIPKLARACGTSPTVLKEAFRETFGMPVYTWYRNYRIRCACELLEEDPSRSVASVAAEVGYANPSKFSRAFKDCVGSTPLAWRNRRVSKS